MINFRFVALIMIVFTSFAVKAQTNFWTQTGLVNMTVGALATDASGYVYTGTIGGGTFEKGLRISTNQGSTWNILGFTHSYIYSIAINASGHIFVATVDSVFRSTDNGATWKYLSVGVSMQIPQTLSIAPSGTVLLGAYSGMFRSTTNGDSWTVSGLTGYEVVGTATGANGFVIAGTDSGIFRSTDEGITWTKSNSGFSMTGIYCFSSFLIKSSQEIYAGAYGGKSSSTNGGVFKSTDGGASWAKVTGVTNNRVFSFAKSSGGHLFVGTMDSAVYRSTDDGVTWATIKSGIWGSYYAKCLAMSSDGYLYAAMGGYGLFRSTTPTSLGITTTELPLHYQLYQNYPNPFNPTTTIKYQLSSTSHVRLTVFDALGQRVAVLVNETKKPGIYTIVFDAHTSSVGTLSGGMYFYRLEAGGRTETKKFVLLK